jgi:hypothetical protein
VAGDLGRMDKAPSAGYDLGTMENIPSQTRRIEELGTEFPHSDERCWRRGGSVGK